MARLCPRPQSRWSSNRPLRANLGRARAAFRETHRQRDNAGGLPRLPPSAQAQGLCGQFDSDRVGIVTRLPAMALRGRCAEPMGSSSFTAARPLADEGASQGIARRDRYTACPAIHPLGSFDRGEGERDTGSGVASRGFRFGYDRLSARRTRGNEQAAHHSADERGPARRIRTGLRRQTDGSCDRVRREAGRISEESLPAIDCQNRHQGFAARPATHLRGLDGARRRSDVGNSAVPGPHKDGDHRSVLCPIFARLHAPRECRDGVLKYACTKGVGLYLTENGGNGGAAYVTRTRDPIITNDVLYQLS